MQHTRLPFAQGLAADRVGIVQGDEILTVDGTDVDRRSPFDTASLIASPPPSVPTNGSNSPSSEVTAAATSPASSMSGPAEAAVVLQVLGTDGKVGVSRLHWSVVGFSTLVVIECLGFGSDTTTTICIGHRSLRAEQDSCR